MGSALLSLAWRGQRYSAGRLLFSPAGLSVVPPPHTHTSPGGQPLAFSGTVNRELRDWGS